MAVEVGDGRNFLTLWNDPARGQSLLDELGKSVKDVTIVYAYGRGLASPKNISITAYRVAGADGEALLQGMVDRYLLILKGWKAERATVGGKAVVVLSAGVPGLAPQHLYGLGDVVFRVDGNPDALVEEALSGLP